MAHSVATGSQFLSLETQQGHVLWYNMDNVFPSDLGERCEELGDGNSTWVNQVTWYDGEMDITGTNIKTSTLHYKEIIDLAKENNTRLIVFDTLSALFANSNINEMYANETDPFMLILLKIARQTDACVLALHHMPKDMENQSGRGSTAIAGKADQEFYFEGKSTMLETVTIMVKKSRTHRVQIFPIEISEDGFSLNSATPTGEPQGAWKGLIKQTQTRSQLTGDIQLFKHNFLFTGFRGEVENEMMAEHKWLMSFLPISQDRINDVIEHLLDEGKLEKEPNGNNPTYTLWFDDPHEIDKAMRKKKRMKKRMEE